MKKHLAFVAGLALSGASHADSSAYAAIDWSSIRVEVTDLSGGSNTPVFSWGDSLGGYGFLHANAETSASTSIPNAINPETPESFTAGVTFASAGAKTFLSSSANTQNGNTTLENRNAFASSTIDYQKQFTLTGFGFALIKVDYSLTASNSPLNGHQLDDYDYSGASAYFSVYHSVIVSEASDVIHISANDSSSTINGTFTIPVYSVSGISGVITARTIANASSTLTYTPVPILPASWLMLTGLLGLIFRAKR